MPTGRHPAPQRLPLAHPNRFAIYKDPAHDAVRRWEAQLDAGRIGARPPADPAVVANLLATDALFGRIACDRRGR